MTPERKKDFTGIALSVIVPELRVADVPFNTAQIVAAMEQAAQTTNSPHLMLFPELCLTGVSCGDLFWQPTLISHSLAALSALQKQTARLNVWAVIGLPLWLSGRLYNTAVLLSPGKIRGVSLQRHPEDSQGYRTSRHFFPGADFPDVQCDLLGENVPVGVDLSLVVDELTDLPVQIVVGHPGTVVLNMHCGLLLNPCALPALALPAQSEHPWQKVIPRDKLAVVAYASSGPCESTTDQVYSGNAAILQNGSILAQTQPLQFSTQIATSLIDTTAAVTSPQSDIDVPEPEKKLSQTPFINDVSPQAQFQQALAIQSAGLMGRLRHTHLKRVVVGISGGADSSLALLVCLHAFQQLGLDSKDILAVSMPGPGSSTASQDRAAKLASLCGVTFLKIPIDAALQQHLADIDHPVGLYDHTYENAQARERTQILMDLANQQNALVVGTGDLSEIALGWSTYNGDHMSMYAVNAGVPKTLLLRHLVWASEALLGAEGKVLAEKIVQAPVSPELLPVNPDGSTDQSTEASIGPYLLQDFYLYHAIAKRRPPQTVYCLAAQAFNGTYSQKVILHWLWVFYQRFFNQQFKRSASPDGPQVTELSLSPRSAWQMPSDASPGIWLNDLDTLCHEGDIHNG